jgi:hypothetical protein
MIWASLVIGVVVLDAVMIYLHKQVAQEEHHASTRALQEMPAYYPELFAVVATCVAVLAVWFPRKLLTDGVSNRRKNIEIADEGGRRVVVKPVETVRDLMLAYQPTFLIGMALSEAVALIGFMLGFLGGSLLVASAFFLVALVLMVAKYPRLSTVIGAIERVTGATCPL